MPVETKSVGSADAYEAWRARTHFAGLDGLRFFAILSVLFMHCPLTTLWGAQLRFFSRGFLGVDFFFVISGFLITTLLLREEDRTGRIALKAFYWRRALRILPLFLVVITAVGGYYAFVKADALSARSWPFYYLFLSNFLTVHIPTLYPTWSLSVEEQYYLVWPLLLVALPRRVLPWVILGYIAFYQVMIATDLANTASVVIGPLDLRPLEMVYGAILLGAGLALMLHRRDGFMLLWKIIGWRWASVFWAAAVLIEFMVLPRVVEGLPQLLIHFTMTALIGSVVVREDNPLMPLLRFKPVRRIGAVSYGIYLLHLQAYHVAHVLIERTLGDVTQNMTIYILVYWGLSWLFAEISFRFYESPFLALRHKSLGLGVRAKNAQSPKGKITP